MVKTVVKMVSDGEDGEEKEPGCTSAQFGVLCFDTVTSRTASKHLSQMFQGSERGVDLARCSISFYFQSHSFPGGAGGKEPAC